MSSDVPPGESIPTPKAIRARDRSTPAWLLAAALALAWCAYLAFFGPKVTRGELPAPRLQPPPGSKASFDWQLQDVDGKPVDFSQYRGKPFFLNVWATWCPPCLREMPAIDNLARNDRIKGLPIVCVSVDDSLAPVRKLLKKRPSAATVLHAKTPPPRTFATDGIPATFIVGADGEVLVMEVGAAQWDAPEVVEFLAKLKPR